MRVAVVHSVYSSRQPSGENVVVQLQVDALRRAGFDVSFVGFETDELEHQDLYLFRSALRVASGRGGSPIQRLREIDPDIVHIHNLFPNFGQKWLEDVDVPIVSTLHNYRPICASGMLLREGGDCVECLTHGSFSAVKHGCYRDSRLASIPLAIATRERGKYNSVLHKSAALVCLSDRSRDTYIQADPALAARISVIPNFGLRTGISDAPDAQSPWLFVGRLTPEKGILELLQAWPTDQPLVVVGSGPLEGQAHELARGKAIQFVGQCSPAQVRQHLVQSKALVFSSRCREGGIAMSYVEALAAGRPTLSIGRHSVSDDVKMRGTGIAVDGFDELPAGSDALDAKLSKLAISASATFEDFFTEAVWLDRMRELYESVLG